jgi:fructose-bisphosphate aldolase, class I
MGSRLKGIGLENSKELRYGWRNLMFKHAKTLAPYISGVILYDETIYQKDENEVLFTKVLADNDIVPGIKVDLGQKIIPGTKCLCTQGLDDLDLRIQKYYKQGARFAKWRASYDISVNQPSNLAISLQAENLARYAAICQANGLVPIVEPEVLVVEGDHDIETSYKVTEKVLAAVFTALNKHKVVLERMLLKPNMILPGKKNANKDKVTTEQIAKLTIKCLKRTVPSAVPGIVFLSGGQTEDEAAINLNSINKLGKHPWYLTYSYGRALQQSGLHAWKGKDEKAGQEAVLKKSKNCSLASKGELVKCE